MLEQYKTIHQDGQHEIKIKGSRFIAHFKRTETEEEALEFIQAIKKEHWKATHNCSAYLLVKEMNSNAQWTMENQVEQPAFQC